MTARRRFLFLQGHATPFYLHLGKALGAAGHTVRRINLCGGDRQFWGTWNADDFSGRLPELGDFVTETAARHGSSDLVLYNDSRPCNAIAIAAARRGGLRVHVFEEGYLRPNWLTLERDGVNGNSRLPNDPAWYRATARELPEPAPPQPVGAGLRQRIIYDFCWQIANYRHWPRYPHYRTHRPYPIWAEYTTWLGRLAGLPRARARAGRLVDSWIRRGQRYFLFPLQLDTDSQIRQHSPFGRLSGAIDDVIADFARTAPRDTHLVIKNHPLDNGWINYRRLVERRARAAGAAARIHFIDGGDLGALIDHAAGIVTVNSTVGLTALERGRPVIALGRAVFGIPGLVFQGDLAAFWRSPIPPDSGLLADFRRVLLQACLVNGNFYTEAGIALAVGTSMARLISDADPLADAPPRDAAAPEIQG
jgi:capsular polysaccharide export protein